MERIIWQNGQFKAYGDATTHVMSHALHYGSGVFEGIRAYKQVNGATAVLALSEHIDRLYDSAKVLDMNIPYTKAELIAAILELIKKNHYTSCYIRPLVYYGLPPTSGVRVLPAIDTPVEVVLACYEMGNYLPDQPIAVKISDFVRIHPKSSNIAAKICGHYINSMQALMQIRNTHYGEVIMLDYEGNISEGSSDNIFIIKDEVIYTPPLGTILQGITRGIVIDYLTNHGYRVVEKNITPKELFACDEAFLVGTAVEVKAVASVNDQDLGNGREGPITQMMKLEYNKICTGANFKYTQLLTLV